MSEENKTAVRKLFDAVNSGADSALQEALSDSFVEHEELPGFPPTKEGTIAFFNSMRAAIPDFRMEVDDMIAEGDKVSVRCRMTGTHKGEFMGFPATGNHIDVSMSDYLRIENGKVVEHWGVMDSGSLMQQLGGGG